MDVHCSSCNEPWDVYHLRHDVIYDIGLTEEEADAWRTVPSKQRLSPHYREKFKAAGWQFGASILDVCHCPACPKGARPDPEKAAMEDAIAEALGDDEDGIASTMEDYGL
jgi:hypothetical protein